MGSTRRSFTEEYKAKAVTFVIDDALSTFTEYFSTAMTNGMIEMTMQTGWAPTTVAVARSQRRRFAAPMCVRSRSCLPSLGVCLGCGRGCPGSGSRWTHQRAWTATKSRDEGWR